MSALHVFPQKCQQSECPSYRRCQNVASYISKPESVDQKNVDVCFVSDQPFEDDVKHGYAFSADSIRFLRSIIRYLGVPANGYGFTSLIRCRPVDRDNRARKPEAVEFDLCRKHLLADLKQMKPKVLVFHGLNALRNVVSAHDMPRVKYNKVFEIELDGQRYLALAVIKTHEVLNATSLIPHYKEGIQKALDLVDLGKKSIHHPARWRADPAIHYCDTVEKVQRLVDHLLYETQSGQACSFDVETRNVNARYGNGLVTLQFCVDPYKEVWVVPYHYQYGPFLDDELVEVRKHIQRLFTEKPGFSYWLTHYGVFEQQQVMEFITDGVTFKNAPMIDIMGLAYICDENRVKTAKKIQQGLSLKMLASEYVGRDYYDLQTLDEREAGNLYKAKPDKLIPYAAEDVICTSLLFSFLRLVAKSDDYWTKAIKLAEHVFSPGFRVFSKLKRNGIFTDLEHLRVLASKVSPLVDRMNEIKKELKGLKAVQKANKILANRISGGQKPLFGTPWVFDLDKQEHQQCLFFEVLELEPVINPRKKKKNKDKHSVDKLFYERYAGTPSAPVSNPIKEVALMQEYSGFKKLATGYTRKIIKLVDPNSETIDHARDCRVRANFGFTDTVTGRPNCTSPNIQNVPRADTPTKASVKNMYCAQQPYGAYRKGKKVHRVLMQLDFSAAEVRWWAIISGDPILAKILRDGKLARDEYRKNPTPENKAKADVAGDIHLQTARLMFPEDFKVFDKRSIEIKEKLKAAKTDEEKKAAEQEAKKLKDDIKQKRQYTKAIVFALIYGGGPKLIAQRIKKEDDLDFVIELCDMFADQFPAGNGWLHSIEKVAQRQCYVESPIGRRRRLPEYLINAKTFKDYKWTHASASRLARNAPIQGVASDGCIIGAGLWLDYIEENKKDWKIVNIVHDSCVTEIPIEDIEEAAAAAEKCFTTKMMNRIRDVWGVNFICPLEVDFDFGIAWGVMKHLEPTKEGWAKMRAWLESGGEEAKQ